MLDQALETIFQEPEQLDINFWLKSIAAQGSGSVDGEIERLIASGILEASKKCWVWIVKTQTCPTLDDSDVRNAKFRIGVMVETCQLFVHQLVKSRICSVLSLDRSCV